MKASLNVPFERVLYALGIRYVGETTARDVARHFGSVDAVASASKEELLEVPEVGDVIAERRAFSASSGKRRTLPRCRRSRTPAFG